MTTTMTFGRSQTIKTPTAYGEIIDFLAADTTPKELIEFQWDN
jgi:hypothetical protein